MRNIFVVVSVVWSLGVSDLHANWPVFRGNLKQDGSARAKLPERLEVRWKFKTEDAIEGTPAIADGVVYIGSYDEHLYALDEKTGRLKWKLKLGPIKASISYHDGRVYAGDIDGKLYCVDAKTHKLIWTYETDGEITAGPSFIKDKLLFGSHDQQFYCLTKGGKLKWKIETEGPVNGAAAVSDGKTFIAGCDSLLHILDIETGKELGTVDLAGQAGATAAVDGDKLFVGTMANQFLGIDIKRQKVLWAYEAKRRSLPFYSSAALTEKLVLVGGRDRKLHALDRRTGKEVWSYLTTDRIDSSPVVAGGKVYFGSLSDDGLFYVLNLKGELVQKLELDGAFFGSPAVGKDCLVVGTERGTVYCLGSK